MSWKGNLSSAILLLTRDDDDIVAALSPEKKSGEGRERKERMLTWREVPLAWSLVLSSRPPQTPSRQQGRQL